MPGNISPRLVPVDKFNWELRLLSHFLREISAQKRLYCKSFINFARMSFVFLRFIQTLPGRVSRILKVVLVIMNKNYPIRNWEEFSEKKFQEIEKSCKESKICSWFINLVIHLNIYFSKKFILQNLSFFVLSSIGGYNLFI